MWGKLGKPCSKRVIDCAMDYLDSREKNIAPDEYVLIHGDAHNNNTLQVPGTDTYKLIDPDGILYEREYDLGVLMREWPEEYLMEPLKRGKERCELIYRITGADANGIWEWGFLQTVSTSMILLQIGEEKLGQEMLKTAEAWCE
jgi:streptomycin 6-kinase